MLGYKLHRDFYPLSMLKYIFSWSYKYHFFTRNFFPLYQWLLSYNFYLFIWELERWKHAELLSSDWLPERASMTRAENGVEMEKCQIQGLRIQFSSPTQVAECQLLRPPRLPPKSSLAGSRKQAPMSRVSPRCSTVGCRHLDQGFSC